MMFGWSERATKASVKHFIGGECPAVVYQIGRYEVTIPGDEISVTYRTPDRDSRDPRTTFPHMEVTDGEIRIPVSDLVGEVLSRVEPVDAAQALWQDDAVREEFMSCLVTRYSQQDVGDADRRKFLAGVREAVHEKALDRLADSMAKIEYDVARIAHFYDEVRRINQTLRDLEVTVMRSAKNDVGEWVQVPSILQFDERERKLDADGKPTNGFGELAVAGRAWQDARAFWRDEVRRQFPMPAPEVEK